MKAVDSETMTICNSSSMVCVRSTVRRGACVHACVGVRVFVCTRAGECVCVRARARTYHTAASYQNRSNWVLTVITGADVT